MAGRGADLILGLVFLYGQWEKTSWPRGFGFVSGVVRAVLPCLHCLWRAWMHNTGSLHQRLFHGLGRLGRGHLEQWGLLREVLLDSGFIEGKYVLGSTEQCSKFYCYLLSSEGTTENICANCRFEDLSNSHQYLASVCAVVQGLSRFTINHNLCKGCALPVGLSNNTPNTPLERLLLSWEVYVK